MANINCPILGEWAWAGSGFGTDITFVNDGTVTFGATGNKWSFLVFENGSAHKLVTFDGRSADFTNPSGTYEGLRVYDFTLSTADGVTTLVLADADGNNPGQLAGTYTTNAFSPAPLNLTYASGNYFLGAWMAGVTGATMGNGTWNLQYSAEGVVSTAHLDEDPNHAHTFTNAYLVREVTDGTPSETVGYLVTYGQYRFGPTMNGPKVATFDPPADPEEPPTQITATEVVGDTGEWSYTLLNVS